MLDRRSFLQRGGFALLSLGAGSAILQRPAWAATSPRRKVLVTLCQRGAMDGLMALQPLDAPSLLASRPRLALTRAGGLIDLGNGFGLHPALGDLLPLWRESRLTAVHAVGLPELRHAHGEAQAALETGIAGDSAQADGWLNRLAAELGDDAAPCHAVAMTPALPRALTGSRPALTAAELAGLGLEARTSRSEAPYPDSPLGDALRRIAALIRQDVGLQIAFAESHGWDTHARQAGAFSRRAKDLGQAIAAFDRDLGVHRDDVLLMTMTEFGRTTAENAGGGTDHGHASSLFLVGAGLGGSRVHGDPNGLALAAGRGLPVETDLRAVWSEVAGAHLGIARPERLFPGYAGPRVPLLAAA